MRERLKDQESLVSSDRAIFVILIEQHVISYKKTRWKTPRKCPIKKTYRFCLAEMSCLLGSMSLSTFQYTSVIKVCMVLDSVQTPKEDFILRQLLDHLLKP